MWHLAPKFGHYMKILHFSFIFVFEYSILQIKMKLCKAVSVQFSNFTVEKNYFLIFPQIFLQKNQNSMRLDHTFLSEFVINMTLSPQNSKFLQLIYVCSHSENGRRNLIWSMTMLRTHLLTIIEINSFFAKILVGQA